MLTARRVETIKEAGMHADMNGLYLCVSAGGAKSWILRATIKGHLTPAGRPYRVEVGLGSVAGKPLAAARAEALRLRNLARDGKNPLDEKRKVHLTFDDAAKRLHAELSPTWKNEHHRQTWLASLQADASPLIGNRPLDTITTADIHRVLSPIWVDKHETAKRLKQRITAVFDWAKGAGHYSLENPVNGLKKALPLVRRQPKNMAAMPWADVPSFMDELQQREGVSALCLRFLIHTATRSGEARGARWGEIEGNLWSIPAERMKRGLPHRVPLSPEAMAVLEAARGQDADLIFPSIQRNADGSGKVMSDMVFKALFLRMGKDGFVTHGFRSSFRDWCSESARAEREVAEAALSHAMGPEQERAYARSDLLDRRRELMCRWSSYLVGSKAEVLSFPTSKTLR